MLDAGYSMLGPGIEPGSNLPGFEILDKCSHKVMASPQSSIPTPKAFLRKRRGPASSYLCDRNGDHAKRFIVIPHRQRVKFKMRIAE
jgi:hypothetical protein